MNHTSTRLVSAARDALAALPNDRTSVEEDAKVATIAVLRELVFMMNQAEVDESGDWPQAHYLHLLANDVETSL